MKRLRTKPVQAFEVVNSDAEFRYYIVHNRSAGRANVYDAIKSLGGPLVCIARECTKQDCRRLIVEDHAAFQAMSFGERRAYLVANGVGRKMAKQMWPDNAELAAMYGVGR